MSVEGNGGRDNFGRDNVNAGEIVMPVVALAGNILFPGQSMVFSLDAGVEFGASLELLEESYRRNRPVAALCYLAKSAVPMNSYFHVVSICSVTEFSSQSLPDGGSLASFTITAVGRGELLELFPSKSTKEGFHAALLAKAEVLLEPTISAEEWDGTTLVMAREQIRTRLDTLIPLAKKFAADISRDKARMSEKAIAAVNKDLLLLMKLPAQLAQSVNAEQFLRHLQNLVDGLGGEVKLFFFEASTVEERINSALGCLDHLFDNCEQYFFNKESMGEVAAGRSLPASSSAGLPQEEFKKLLKRVKELLLRMDKLQNKGGGDGSGGDA